MKGGWVRLWRNKRVSIRILGLAVLLGAVAPAVPDEIGRELLEARNALTQGRLPRAEELYRELIARDPQRVEPYQGLAEVFAARGERDEARALLVDVGRKLDLLARYRDAVAPLERAVELAPGDLEAHLILGRVLAKLERFQSAAALFERLVERGESHSQALLQLAAAYRESGRSAAAEDVYRRLLKLHGDVFPARLRLGQLLLSEGKASEARELLERVAAARPGDTEALYDLARARTESGDAEAAAAAYERLLELDPESFRAAYALDLLDHRGTVRPRAEPPAADGSAGRIVLTRVAADTGLVFRHDPGTTTRRHLPEIMGAGLAWLDYDGDGWWDLYLVQSGPFPPDGGPAAADRLFRNRGDGTFEERAADARAVGRCYGQGAVAADVDGDGTTDLYLTCYGRDVLLRNRRDGTFVDRTAEAGLGLDGWSSSAALADVDRDGDLDLYVTRYVDYDPDHTAFCGDEVTGEPDYCNVIFFRGTADRFYRQRADGTFEEATAAAGITDTAARGLGVVLADLDGDFFPDLYVTNDMEPNFLYQNRGAVFEDVSLLSGAALSPAGRAEASMGVAVGDVDSDGLPDLGLSHFVRETNTLYRNLGGLAFDDASATSGFGLPSLDRVGFGIVWADLDLDGDLDAYVTNGHVYLRPLREGVTLEQRDLVLAGDGHGRFQAAGQELDLPSGVGRGVAAADYDNDGDLDVAVQQNDGEAELLRNDGGGRWLGVELSGRARNTWAVGARVTLVTGRRGAAASRRQVRWVLVGGSYQSSSERRLLFAWPADEGPEELAVRWPGGGVTQLRRPPEGFYLHLREPAP